MKKFKIAIIGSGATGSAMAYSLFLRCPDIEIAMINRDERKSWAKSFDISHCSPELPDRKIYHADASQCSGFQIIIMTAGALPRENGTRAEVIKDNVEIFRNLIPILARNNPDAVIVNITNPSDAMAYCAWKLSGFPSQRIISTGTELDSMRIMTLTAKNLNADPAKFRIEIIGEHGETMVPLWSRAAYAGSPICEVFPELDDNMKNDLIHRTRRAGWDIRQAGEHSIFAISFSATRIIEAIMGLSSKPVLVSTEIRGEFGISGPYLSLPSRLSEKGVTDRIIPEISEKETRDFEMSSKAVKKQMEEVDRFL